MEIGIYIAAHKPYPRPEDPAYIPIHVGAAGKDPLYDCHDDTAENISQRNGSFCELTALYWIWKNAPQDIVGLVHYRRHFCGKGRGKDPWKKILTGNEMDAYLENAEILLPRKRHYVIETNYSQYAHAHYEKDIQMTRQVLSELEPAYLSAFDTVMNRRSGHRFNMFIAKKTLLDRYCQWLFPLLFTLEQRIDVSGYDAYNRRVIGFLGERLLDVWLEKEGIPYRELPVIHLEGENWLRKGLSFCMRKLKPFRRMR